MPLLRFLICFLGVGASCAILSGQEATKSANIPGRSLAVLVDTSAHQTKVIEFEREAVNSIASVFSTVGTDAFVVGYGDEVHLLQDQSPVERLKAVSPRIELDKEGGNNSNTLLYEALENALSKLETSDRTNSKVVIVIGEGNDAGSRTKYSEIKKRAKSRGIQCFALLIADHNLMGGRVRHFGFDLYDLASATKGKAYDIEHNPKKLNRAINDVRKRVLGQQRTRNSSDQSKPAELIVIAVQR